MQHTMSMYPNKTSMIEAMQAEIDLLEEEQRRLHKESLMLKWLVKNSYHVEPCDFGGYQVKGAGHTSPIVGHGTTPYQAIANGMSKGSVSVASAS